MMSDKPWKTLNVPMTNNKMHMGVGPLIIKRGTESEVLRVQACVNACLGISNEALDGGVVKEMVDLIGEFKTFS